MKKIKKNCVPCSFVKKLIFPQSLFHILVRSNEREERYETMTPPIL